MDRTLKKKTVADIPNLLKSWDYEKNGDLRPEDVLAYSRRKIMWGCDRGHNWETSPAYRANYGCPFCSGRRPIVGETDLATVRPDLVAEWDYIKNGDLRPEDVKAHSVKKVHWKCAAGHEWEASPAYRFNYGCPFCSGRRPIAGETDLATVRPDLAAEWDYEKNGNLRPENVKPHSTKEVHWKCAKGHGWVATPDVRFRTGCPFCAGKRPIVGETDLATLRPDLVAEWDYAKNGDLLPCDVTIGSDKEAFWNCRYGHSWKAKICNRTRGCNCPYCARRRPVIGVNDLATLHPELVPEWNEVKNGTLRMQDFTEFSNKKVWWMCEKGHEWETSPSMRVGKGSNCPYCYGNRPIRGQTDLATMRPNLAAEWNYDRNEDSSPDSITLYSNKKVWWMCAKGHEWMSTVQNRAFGNSCPFCSGRNPIIGETDLATLRPDLVAEWHPTRNGSKIPENYTVGSGAKVWWQCAKGHEWESTIYVRVNSTLGCPFCAGKRVIEGETDFATLRPQIAQEWHPKNTIGPDEVLPHSEKRVWWICEKGHEWEAPVYSRFDGAGCPYCLGKKPIRGETDAATLFPNLINEWNQDRNGNLSLSDFTQYSSRKVWWKCDKGHEWQASVGHRGAGENCPYCAGKGRKARRGG